MSALGADAKVPGIPSDETLTRSISVELYGLYVMGSQFAHGTLMTSVLAQRPAAAPRIRAEKSWAILINLAWLSARNACVVLLNAAQLPVDVRMNDVDRDFEAALERIRQIGPV
jgi:hypothetical protein